MAERKTGPMLNATQVLLAKELVSQSEIITEFQITRQTLKNWRDRFGFPQFSAQHGRERLYRTQDVLTWLKANKVRTEIV
ncbi:MAG: hypothetical protein DI498_11440 [Paracoccus denitrificans]|nr:MAG: hypothetical protein DI498_11440 [Paracoccus denitrificans]PZO83475.1 MAG: hypothetical protein DI633_11440 [Paracoccus denitrificans]